MVEGDALGLSLVAGGGRRGMDLIGAIARGDEAVAGFLELCLGGRRELDEPVESTLRAYK